MPAGWAALAAAVVGAGASVYASNKQSSAAKDAAKLSQGQYQSNVQMQQPYVQSGYGAIGKLNTLLGINPDPNAPRAVNLPIAPGNMTWNGPRELMQNGHFVDNGQPIPTKQQIMNDGVYHYNPSQQINANELRQPVKQQANPQLRQILQIRADNGDPQAKQMLGMLQ